MLIGFDVVAARSKKTGEEDDTPVQESMRGERKLLSNPSTDQKKTRRRQQKSASDLITTEATVRSWYEKRKRTAPAKDGFGCEICNDGGKCSSCGYSASSQSAIARRVADVLSTGEDR